MSRPALALLLTAALGLTACAQDAGGSGGGGQDGLRAAAAFYPLEYALQRVGGERVEVEGLTPPGVEPHDLELGARQTARVVDADLLVHLDGFQPAVDALAEQVGDRAFDVASAVDLEPGGPHEDGAHEDGTSEQGAHEDGAHEDGAHEDGASEDGASEDGAHEDGAVDPHLWLDPTLLAGVGDALAERLAEADPEGADAYAEGARALREDLEALDAEFRAGLASCARKDLVVSHEAFGYLARRYGLRQVGISGFTPEAEPTAARVREAARFARENGVTTIFFETLVSPAVARTVAQEVGATTAVLDPVEGRPEDGDYLTAMRADLAALRAGLGCT